MYLICLNKKFVEGLDGRASEYGMIFTLPIKELNLNFYEINLYKLFTFNTRYYFSDVHEKS